jgi:pimeloyl-ACP methyl ester carboxylesterase
VIEPGFVDRDGAKMFTVYFPPTGAPNPVGFVLCNAFASETEVFRVHLVRFARLLAARGYPTLRFDYVGYGDSEGAFADAAPSTMAADIEAAIAELSRRSGVTRIGLVGIRLGGTLAAQVAARRDDVELLALWEPLPRPWEELWAELRSTVSLQTVLFKDVKKTRDDILAGVLAGTPTLVDGFDLNVIDDGFPLGKRLVEEARAIDLIQAPPAIRARTLILHVRRGAPGSTGEPGKRLAAFTAAMTKAGAAVTADVATESTLPWLHEATYTTASERVYERTLAWLEAAC